MLDNTILTIAIPTFQRQQVLERTLQSLTPLSNISNVQILVIDNCSDDGTWEWLCRQKDKLGITIKRNIVNLGVEGNIICALLHAKGDYVWLLSDHTIVNISEVITFIRKLKAGLKFTFGYTRSPGSASILPEPYTPIELKSLDQYSLGEIIFFMSNISLFIINKNYLGQCARTVFRFSGYSYPHLGVFVHADKNETFVDLPIIRTVSFIVSPKDETMPIRISYDTFRTRFIGFPRAVDEIKRLNPNLKHIHKALKTPGLIRALFYDAVSNLCFATSNSVTPFEYIFCLRHYPGKIRLFLTGCILLSVLPEKIRFLVSRAFFRILSPSRYQKAVKRYKLRFSSEIIRE